MLHCIFCASLPFPEAKALFKRIQLCHSNVRITDPTEYKLKVLNDEQLDFPAELESLLWAYFPENCNINVELDRLFPDRDYDAIRGIRKLKSFKIRYNEFANLQLSSNAANISNNFSPSLSNDTGVMYTMRDIRDNLSELGQSEDNLLSSSFNASNSLLDTSVPVEKFECSFCQRIFGSKIGRSQHCRHPHEYAKQIQLGMDRSRNTLWDDEEIYLVAKFELDLLHVEGNIKNINQRLHALLPLRSINQIACLRKRIRYKDILEAVRGERVIMDDDGRRVEGLAETECPTDEGNSTRAEDPDDGPAEDGFRDQLSPVVARDDSGLNISVSLSHTMYDDDHTRISSAQLNNVVDYVVSDNNNF